MCNLSQVQDTNMKKIYKQEISNEYDVLSTLSTSLKVVDQPLRFAFHCPYFLPQFFHPGSLNEKKFLVTHLATSQASVSVFQFFFVESHETASHQSSYCNRG
jgi:hypothetical protein